jgi:membrane-bound ClpP family serine protease
VVAVSRFQRDLVERVLRTAAQAAIAVVVVQLSDPGFTVDSLQTVAVAAIAAAVSAGMALIGKTIGDPDSGSWES